MFVNCAAQVPLSSRRIPPHPELLPQVDSEIPSRLKMQRLQLEVSTLGYRCELPLVLPGYCGEGLQATGQADAGKLSDIGCMGKKADTIKYI
jgi:hypothetical protein